LRAEISKLDDSNKQTIIDLESEKNKLKELDDKIN
jgi:hypothetical protein